MNTQAIKMFLAAATCAAAMAVGGCSDTSSGMDAATGSDAGVSADSGVLDAGNECISPTQHCNTCKMYAEDTRNACTSAAGNCVPFDANRVPMGPDGHRPAVP
ncbi:MAG: hypothetical protein U1E65_03345 [Myxococcota bacterium]